jgi:ketosteroid isomerase-like protein
MSTAALKDQTSRDEADIRTLIESGNKAHHAKDAAAIVAQYAPGAVVFDLSPPLVSRIGGNLQGLEAWLDTWEGLDREARDFSIAISGDLAFCHGFYRLSGTPKALDHEVGFWMRATVCLRRGRGAWRIVHQHTSVPFYMDGSLRPAFDLKP